MRSSRVTAALLVLATMGPVPLLAQRNGTGSEVPCAVPMTWAVAEIDARFDLTRASARRALRDAASLWERGVGTSLFAVAPGEGYPVLFHFDERQAALAARQARMRSLDADRQGVESARRELEDTSRTLENLHAAYQRDLAEYNAAIQAYNQDLQRLSRDREVPATVRAEMERREAELDERSRALRDRQRELNRRSASIQAEVERFNRRVDDLRRAEDSLVRDFPVVATESGTYDETISSRNGRVVSVDRRIRIFQFATYEDLVLVLAHELGHALGVGHAPGPGAVMSEIIVSGDDALPSGAVTPTDLSLLAARCPGLGR